MIRLQRPLLTNWWQSFVDGTNPEDRGRQLVSAFFRKNLIDPYKLEHAVVNDYRRWLMLEVVDPPGKKKGKGGPKAAAIAMDRLAEIKRFELGRLQRDYPLNAGVGQDTRETQA